MPSKNKQNEQNNNKINQKRRRAQVICAFNLIFTLILSLELFARIKKYGLDLIAHKILVFDATRRKIHLYSVHLNELPNWIFILEHMNFEYTCQHLLPFGGAMTTG